MSIQSSDWIVFLCLFRAKTAAPQRTGPASTAHQRFDTRRANRPCGEAPHSLCLVTEDAPVRGGSQSTCFRMLLRQMTVCRSDIEAHTPPAGG
jgi:hypothetical protein